MQRDHFHSTSKYLWINNPKKRCCIIDCCDVKLQPPQHLSVLINTDEGQVFLQFAFAPLFTNSSGGTDVMFWRGSNVKIRWRMSWSRSLTQDKWQLTWRCWRWGALWRCCAAAPETFPEKTHLWAFSDTSVSRLWRLPDKHEWMRLNERLSVRTAPV